MATSIGPIAASPTRRASGPPGRYPASTRTNAASQHPVRAAPRIRTWIRRTRTAGVYPARREVPRPTRTHGPSRRPRDRCRVVSTAPRCTTCQLPPEATPTSSRRRFGLSGARRGLVRSPSPGRPGAAGTLPRGNPTPGGETATHAHHLGPERPRPRRGPRGGLLREQHAHDRADHGAERRTVNRRLTGTVAGRLGGTVRRGVAGDRRLHAGHDADQDGRQA